MTYFIEKVKIAMIVLLLSAAGQPLAMPLTNKAQENSSCCASPCQNQGFLGVELLYWNVYQGGFVCGCVPDEMNNCMDSYGDVFSKFKGNNRDPGSTWNPGFRFGAGYEFGEQNWNIAVYWTNVHSKTHQNHHFHWKLDFNVVDVLIGRNFYAECLLFTPFIGVRAAQIDQKVRTTSLFQFNTFFDLSSFPENLMSSSESEFFFAEERGKENFSGIGPLIGIEVDWDIGCDFSLFAAASVSTLYGNFNLRFSGCNSFFDETNYFRKKSHSHACEISTDAIIGVRWEQNFCENMQVILQLALEQHRYFNHNRLGSYGDLCLDGGSFSASIVY